MERRPGRYNQEPVKDPVSGIPLPMIPEPVTVTPHEAILRDLLGREEEQPLLRLTRQPRAVFDCVTHHMRCSPEEVERMVEAGIISYEDAQRRLTQKPPDYTKE